MQKYAIMLGGLERGYMKKLALYLSERFLMPFQIGISEKEEPTVVTEEESPIVWVGSEKFIRYLREHTSYKNLITLTEEEEEDETHIFLYQSREKLYRGIQSRCQKAGCFPAIGTGVKRQRWLAVTANGCVGDLLAFSIVCARILSESHSVLYVNLSECCGMTELFSLEQDTDFGELFLELRENKEAYLEEFTGSVDGLKVVMPTENPMILYEINAEDMWSFLKLIQNEAKYEWIVFAVGNTICGCEQIFAQAEKIFHLTGKGPANICASNARQRFLRQCLNDSEKNIVKIPMPEICGERVGPHLLDDWRDGTLGRMAERYIKERENRKDGDRVAED